MDDFWQKFDKKDMTVQEQDALGKELASKANTFVPAIISFAIVLIVGFTLLPRLELYFEEFLLQYIGNQFVVTVLIFAVAFGPILLLEDRMEKLFTKIIKKYYLRKK